MVYRRYNKRRRGRGRRRGFHPYVKASAPAVGYVAYKAAQMVAKKWLNPEFKSHELDTNTNFDDTGEVIYLTGIAQGDADNTRDGDSIKATGMSLNMTLTQNAAATETFVRIMLIRDNDFAGTNTPVIGGAGGVLDTTDDFRAMKNLDQTRRYHVLYDKMHIIHSVNGRTKYIKIFKKMSHHVRYVDTGAGSGSGGNGALWLMIITNEDTNLPNVNYQMRLRYLDN